MGEETDKHAKVKRQNEVCLLTTTTLPDNRGEATAQLENLEKKTKKGGQIKRARNNAGGVDHL